MVAASYTSRGIPLMLPTRIITLKPIRNQIPTITTENSAVSVPLNQRIELPVMVLTNPRNGSRIQFQIIPAVTFAEMNGRMKTTMKNADSFFGNCVTSTESETEITMIIGMNM